MRNNERHMGKDIEQSYDGRSTRAQLEWQDKFDRKREEEALAKCNGLAFWRWRRLPKPPPMPTIRRCRAGGAYDCQRADARNCARSFSLLVQAAFFALRSDFSAASSRQVNDVARHGHPRG